MQETDGGLIEEWRQIARVPDGYLVSNLGRIRSPRKILKTPLDRYGYPRVALRSSGKQIFPTVHSLVAEAFIGPRPPGLEVGHLNGDRQDNRSTNLTYVTSKENSLHQALHGTRLVGERHGQSKLTAEQVKEIINNHSPQHPLFGSRPLARKYGVHPATIRRIVRGANWSTARAAYEETKDGE